MSTEYTMFVKNNYAKFKEKNPETNSKDMLRLIAAEWNATKPKKAKDAAKPKPKVLKRTAKAKAPPIEIDGANIKDSINNIQDASEQSPPPAELIEKVTRSRKRVKTPRQPQEEGQGK